MASTREVSLRIPPIELPVQFERPQFGAELVELDGIVGATTARATFGVDGSGLTVAVLDTGLRTSHVDFAGRVRTQLNLTGDYGGDPLNAADRHGHGTSVSGVIVAGGRHTGVAPGASIVPIKVLTNGGNGSFAWVQRGLEWVVEHGAAHDVSVVCLSLGDGRNWADDSGFANDEIRMLLRTLRARGVPAVAAAGNEYFRYATEGMAFPAILREAVSVGAVYDADEGRFDYADGAIAFRTATDRIAPFSQRLHSNNPAETRTELYAPGALATSSGIANDGGESIQQGTGQAAPVVAGVVLLMQQYHRLRTGRLPGVDDLETWLRAGAVPIDDVDDEDDNVPHTKKTFLRVDAVGALDAVRRGLQKQLFVTQRPFRNGGAAV